MDNVKECKFAGNDQNKRIGLYKSSGCKPEGREINVNRRYPVLKKG